MLSRRLETHARCDACGSRAFGRAEWWQPKIAGEFRYEDGEVVELYFCAHHLRQHRDALSRIPGVYLIDETEFVLQ